MVSLCGVYEMGGFCTRTGHGVPEGMVAYEGGTRENNPRYGEIMTLEEAQKDGLERGFLVEFRKTRAFLELAATFYNRYYGKLYNGRNITPFEQLCTREEINPEWLITKLRAEDLI